MPWDIRFPPSRAHTDDGFNSIRTLEAASIEARRAPHRVTAIAACDCLSLDHGPDGPRLGIGRRRRKLKTDDRCSLLSPQVLGLEVIVAGEGVPQDLHLAKLALAAATAEHVQVQRRPWAGLI